MWLCAKTGVGVRLTGIKHQQKLRLNLSSRCVMWWRSPEWMENYTSASNTVILLTFIIYSKRAQNCGAKGKDWRAALLQQEPRSTGKSNVLWVTVSQRAFISILSTILLFVQSNYSRGSQLIWQWYKMLSICSDPHLKFVILQRKRYYERSRSTLTTDGKNKNIWSDIEHICLWMKPGCYTARQWSQTPSLCWPLNKLRTATWVPCNVI